MLKIVSSRQFKKDMKLVRKRGFNTERLRTVIKRLANGETLEPKYRDHNLTGNNIGLRECHIQPDWLLVYRINQNILELYLSRTGTHSDVFS